MFAINDIFNLSGKISIITGGNGGIGKQLAYLLSYNGSTVIIASRNLNKCNEVVSEIERNGGKAFAIQTDVTIKKSVDEMVEKVYLEFGKIDILINSAGVVRRAPFVEMTEEDWDIVLNTNLKGTYLCCQAVGRKMIKKGYGKIINFSSDKGFVAFKDRAAYCASKGGVVQLTKVLAVEWAEFNIQVNGIAPAIIETEMTRDILIDPDKYQEITNVIPMKRAGKPSELFGVVLLLASDSSSFITGHTILVDGGGTAW